MKEHINTNQMSEKAINQADRHLERAEKCK